MSTTMNDQIEQRVKTLELKVGFLENWKNTPFIQVTLPIMLSIFLATSWNSFGLTSMDKSIGSLGERIGSVEKRVDRLEVKVDRLEVKVDRLEVNVGRLENKMDKVLSELVIIKSELKKS